MKDKVVVVTGGTKGIGRGVALIAADEGARVVIHGRSRKEGLQTVKEIEDRYRTEALFVEGDIGHVDNCCRLIAEAEKQFGRVDGLVNNAGIFPRGTLVDTEEDLFNSIFDINIKSAFFCSKFAVESMLRHRGGSIVHMGSTHGYKGGKDLAAYACSKGALHTLNKHIAAHYAKDGIRSNWVTVGWVPSDGELDRLKREGLGAEDLEDMGRRLIPSGNLQTSEDMAYGVVYLLSDESKQVTGTDLHITGAFNI